MGLSEAEQRAEQLKESLRSGRITAGELKDRLRRMIDAELAKDSRDIDTAYVDACFGLLAELSGGPKPQEEGYFDRLWASIQSKIRAREERKRTFVRASAIAAAAVLVVVLLGTVSVQLRWFKPYSTPDGQKYVVDGQQITMQSVAEAINQREIGSSYQTERQEEIESFLGFSLEGAVPDLEGWRKVRYSAENLEKEIRLDILFRRDGQAEDLLQYRIRWITDYNYLKDAAQPEGEGEYVTVGGGSAFRSEEQGVVSYTWSQGMEVYQLTGAAADEVAEAFVSLNPVQEDPVTEEMLQKLIEKYAPHRSYSSERIEEVESFLGFSLSSVFPVPQGWVIERTSAVVFSESIIVNSWLRSLERYDVKLSYTIHWFFDREGMGYSFEQDEAGKYMTVNGRTVYRSTNYGQNFYVWFGKNVFYSLHGEQEIDELIGQFVNPGADSKASDSVTRSGNPEKALKTVSRREAESFLGVSLQKYLPVMEGWEAEYAVSRERGNAFLRVKLTDSLGDGGELIYQAAWLSDYESFRGRYLTRDHTGRYRRVDGWFVFRNVSDEGPSYTWYRGPAVQTLSGPSTEAWIRRFLEVGVNENTSEEEEEEITIEEEPEPPIPADFAPDTDRVTGVSRAALSELLERYGSISGFITADLGEVEEYLGFSPRVALPVLPEWETDYYDVRVESSAVSLWAVMKNAQRDRETLTYVISWCFDDRFLRDRMNLHERIGESTLVNGRKVYRSVSGKQAHYAWFDGFTAYSLNGVSADEMIGQLVNAAQDEEPGGRQ